MNEVSLFGIFFSALLINNILLIRFLGLCSFFGVSRQMEVSLGMSMAVIFVMTVSSAVTWILYNFILVPLNLEFLKISTFILVIASLVQLEELFLKRYVYHLYRALGIYLPLVTTNCAILAVAFLHVSYSYGFIQTIIYALGVSLGYTIAIMLFTGIRMRLEIAPIPAPLKGYPTAFFIAALMSLAFLGFKGLFGL
ncbi:MAG: RnfABCDGE type electron transport complex subunit A [Elusimicrobiota bacterium]|nr:RnfABCDGE type electron transport complex subunit A [Elusimicrobiota bacterium]MDH5661778.1 RnfABCDGE type electron transport complex subunit A [Elusimicrobiota bacterium]